MKAVGGTGLPHGWAEGKLGEIAEVRLGRQRSPEKATGDHMRPYLRAANVVWTGLDLSDVKQMNFVPKEQEIYRLRRGDILMSEASGSASEVGKPAIWSDEIENCCFQNTLIRVRPPDGFTRFLYFQLLRDALAGRFADNSKGVGIHHLGAERCSELLIKIPPLKEQERIVAAIEQHLSGIDAGVAALERVLANLKRYRAAVLKAACEGRLVPTEANLARNEGRAYEAADALLKRILEDRRARWESDQLAKMKTKYQAPHHNRWKAKYEEPKPLDLDERPTTPEGWCWTSLEGLLRESLRNGHSAKAVEANVNAGVRTLTLTAVTEGDFTEANTKLTVADPEKIKDLWLEPGDILVERANTPELVGTARRFPGPRDFAIFPDLLIRVRVSERLPPSFIELVLHSDRIRRYYQRRAQGIAGTMPKIDQGTVSMSPIPIPPLPEQHRIVAEVERLLSVAEQTELIVRAQLARAARLRQSVLKRAFEGKLVPQDPRDEPASALLARIRAEGQTSTPSRGRRRAASGGEP